MRCLQELLFSQPKCHLSLSACNSKLSLRYIIVNWEPPIQYSSPFPIVPDNPPPNLSQNNSNPDPDLPSMRKFPRLRLHRDSLHALSVSWPGGEFLLRPCSRNESCSDSSIWRPLSLGPRLLPLDPHPAPAQKNPDWNLPPCLCSLLLPRHWCS